jgi:DNA-directed RNA polymerase subunit RPC12/RpoP
MELKKIQEFVVEKKIKPSDCLYHTQRDAKNSNKEPTGKIRVLVPKSDGIARVEYICPECGHYGYTEQEWKRPFSIKCDKCGFKLTVPKMKQEFKKEQKAEKGK